MLPILPLFLFFFAVVNADDYLNEIQGRCYATRKSYSCTKYEFFKYIDDFQISGLNLTREVKFITIPSANVSDVGEFEKARQFEWDSEVVKIVKFFKRKARKFLREQGVSVDLPEEVQIVEAESRGIGDGRGKKKKQIILPILILLKLFKVKVMVSMILGAVLLIKKMLIVAAFIIPSALAAIKTHCKAQQYHVVPYQVDEDHHTYDHEHVEDDGGYEFSSLGGDKHYWDKKRRFYYPKGR